MVRIPTDDPRHTDTITIQFQEDDLVFGAEFINLCGGSEIVRKRILEIVDKHLKPLSPAS